MIATAVFTAKVVLELDEAEAYWLKYLVDHSNAIEETDALAGARRAQLINSISAALKEFK